MEASLRTIIYALFSGLVIATIFSSCKKDDNPVKFTDGTFSDSIINLQGLNSSFDDYNADLYVLYGKIALVFSSNRKSSGGQFDIEQGEISYQFDLTNGNFVLISEITNDSFTSKLIGKAVTPDDDFGPYHFFSTSDGFEYFMLSSVNAEGNLDLYYLKNPPVYGSNIPEITGPKPVNLFNTSSDDAYICFDVNMDSAYFASDRDGNFDIFLSTMNADKPLSELFDMHFLISSKPDSINSTEDDKCPIVHRGVMVFASNRLGGLGGYDLYYSVFKNGKWNSPVNFGPGINTSSDEYRPVLGSVQDFTNSFLIFSSNRPGGKGGFDLYFMGLDLPN
ncbi:MAG: hypothetical protein A2X03_18475 [Bacteroidetes bacterium GWA2_40_15]|nr:MAG: hypothetical protein A2X03_18475 [Bacteroidetes bacterium GWA2_40_15]